MHRLQTCQPSKLRLARRWSAAAAWCLALTLVLLSAMARAQSPSVVLTREYTLPPAEGFLGELILGQDGNFYGTTHDQAESTGTIFRLTPDGTRTTLYRFDGTGGAAPRGLLRAPDGSLYGLTTGPTTGPAAAVPSTVFRLSVDGTLTTLHTFPAGVLPGLLLRATDGSLYGRTTPFPIATATAPGGIFRLAADGSFAAFSPFAAPFSTVTALLQAADGGVYGTATQGTAASAIDPAHPGLLFWLAPDGTAVRVRRFDQEEGAPLTLLQAADGSFYSFVVLGVPLGGVVPDLALSRTLLTGGGTTLPRAAAGSILGATQAKDGNFYAVQLVSTTRNFYVGGAIVCAAPGGTSTLVYNFPSTLGEAGPLVTPLGSLVQTADGSFHGLARDGNVTFVYRLDVTVPSVNLGTPTPTVTAGGGKGKFVFTLSGPWEHDLQVAYAIKGNAEPGVDYKELSGLVTIPAGETSAFVRVKPKAGSAAEPGRRKLKLRLSSGAGYTVGTGDAVKIKLVAP